jgi:hypothetical protein
MPPLPPRVVGPLSECSTSVHVQGQVTGSTVQVLANGDRIASAQATGPDRFVTVPAGALRPGARITAVQSFGGESSDPSPDPVVVQARPATPGRPRIVTHLSVGTECVRLDGMVPGAKVTVQGGSGVFTATADDGAATVGVKPLARNETLKAHQTACGVDGPPTPGAQPDPAPSPLPPPSLAGLAACATEFAVSGAVEGAHVVFGRSQGPGGVGCFPVSALTFRVDPPLHEGEQVTVRQELPLGQAPSADATGTVGPKPPEPVIAAPLCAGATSVHVSGLTVGTRIELRQGGQAIGYAEAPAATFDIPVTGLTAGKDVSLAYQSCDLFTETRRKVRVDPSPARIAAPAVRGPLVECGAVVRVTGLQQGTRAQVWSAALGAPIGEAYATATQVDVPVAPVLIAKDDITAVQIGCGHTSDPSPAQSVAPLGAVAPPAIRTPLTTHATAVTVQGVVPGARVEVYIDGRWRASADAGVATVDVPVGPLRAGAKVAARQAICAQATDLGGQVTVTVPAPTVTLLASTTRIVAGGQVTLKWASTDATGWVLAPDGDTLRTASGTIAKHPAGSVTYTLTATGPGGRNQASARVEVTPPPPTTGTINGQYRVTYSQTDPVHLVLTVTAAPVAGGQPVTRTFTRDLPPAAGVIFPPQDQFVPFLLTGVPLGQWRVTASSNLVPGPVTCTATVNGNVTINANVPGVPHCG